MLFATRQQSARLTRSHPVIPGTSLPIAIAEVGVGPKVKGVVQEDIVGGHFGHGEVRPLPLLCAASTRPRGQL